MNEFKDKNPFAAYNNPMYQNNPFAPWNNPLYKNNPFACWNSPLGRGDYEKEVKDFTKR